ncbi:hypothetical protein OCO53_25570 [Peribacillus frigoritolerans]|uniref:hypothetical protein n=1 Tax=Peribacillus frigoritolerans TaxID=450367 RepID=UPI0021D0CAED|nr:hypothetical protein [Peribacillus frigoritolerans]MCU6603813.1 hypothetical protein [Peribacillus frigoritolerans]
MEDFFWDILKQLLFIVTIFFLFKAAKAYWNGRLGMALINLILTSFMLGNFIWTVWKH